MGSVYAVCTQSAESLWARARLSFGVTRQSDVAGGPQPMQKLPAQALGFFRGCRTGPPTGRTERHVELKETTVRGYTQAAGAASIAEQKADLELLERERPPAAAGPAVQYLSADGAIVPRLGGEWPKSKMLAIGAVEVRPGDDGQPVNGDRRRSTRGSAMARTACLTLTAIFTFAADPSRRTQPPQPLEQAH